MRKTLLVAGREFRQRVRSRGFIIGSLALPIFLIIMFLVTGDFGMIDGGGPTEGTGQSQPSLPPLGYVDQADLIQIIPAYLPQEVFSAYGDEQAARTAVQAGEIEAYYLIPADYRQTGRIERMSLELPTDPADTGFFNQLLLANLMPERTPEEAGRISWPFPTGSPDFVSLAPESDGEETAGFSMLPFIVTIAVMMPLFTSGSYLLESVTKEKSSRIMEILLVSLRPWHMLAGKLIGLGALTLVQYLIWAAITGAVMLVTGQGLPSLLSGVNLTGAELALALPFALGGFVLYAGLMAGIGALSRDMEGSRGWVFIISLPMMIPIYLWVAIIEAPNGPLAVALSMIPFSAPIAMIMRMVSSTVPAWQLGLSLALLLLTGVGMVWLMARLFRVQTLLSGESFSLKRLGAALRGA